MFYKSFQDLQMRYGYIIVNKMLPTNANAKLN